MPEAEVILWTKLQRKQLGGHKFRRQFGVGKYSVDFYCPKLKLAIEVDGDSHFRGQAKKKDSRRESYVEQFGIEVLRFTNDDVRANLDGVLLKIEEVATERERELALSQELPPAALRNRSRPLAKPFSEGVLRTFGTYERGQKNGARVRHEPIDHEQSFPSYDVGGVDATTYLYRNGLSRIGLPAMLCGGGS
jgi:very-short-patch-repair endonuclease